MPTIAEILADDERQRGLDILKQAMGRDEQDRLRSESLPNFSRMPLNFNSQAFNSWLSGLPESTNVVRGPPAPWSEVLSKNMLGVNLPKIIEELRATGLPPLDAKSKFGELIPLVADNPLSKAAGYNDIPVYRNKLNLPFWER